MNFDIMKLMEQAKVLQNELENKQKEAENNIAFGEAGAGMVSVKINGANKILAISIADELMNPSEKKMLEDLVVAAVNNAIQNILIENQKGMDSIASMLPNIPGLGKIL
jgi:DNA-binding YbaB/EbfC family protein